MTAHAESLTAFSSWHAARKRLSCALAEFYDATSDLLPFAQHGTSLLENGLRTLDDEIAMLQTNAERLAQTQVNMKILRNHLTTLVPIRRLPTEILTSIWSLAIHQDHTSQSANDRSRERAVVAIASVSSYWRRIALSMPALWSHMSLDPSRPIMYQTHWLARGMNHPLYLYVHGKSSPPLGLLPFPFGLLQMIRSHFHRVESLYLGDVTSSGSMILRNMCTSDATQTPRLRSVTVYNRRVGFVSWFRLKNNDVQFAGALRLLASVRTLHLRYALLCPWNQFIAGSLTELTLEDFPDDVAPTRFELVEILRASPNLQTLRLWSINPLSGPNSHTAPVHLGELTFLSFKSLSPEWVSWILRRVQPATEGVRLVLNFGSPEYNVGGALNLDTLIPSSLRLRTLVLRGVRTCHVGTEYNTQGAKFTELVFINSVALHLPNFFIMLQAYSVEQLRLYVRVEGLVDRLRSRLPGVTVTEESGEYMDDPGFLHA